MKPSGPVARRGDYRIGPCPHSIASALVREHHYAKGAANTSVHAHCLVRARDGHVVGAALWMPPTARAAKGLAERELGTRDRHREVLALSRLVVAPGEPQNAATLLLGASERLVRRDPRWALLVTYADTGRGHAGGIYKATNWREAGVTVPTTTWLDPDGKQVALKAKRTRTVAEMKAKGLTRGPKTVKLRFVKVVR